MHVNAFKKKLSNTWHALQHHFSSKKKTKFWENCSKRHIQKLANGISNAVCPKCCLFISLVAPFRAVTGNTIRRWVKTFLKSAGGDTEIFCAHSTRSAASSLAVARGISIDKILQAGNRASQTTFSRFYNREQTTTFAASVLADA
jgi:hypothetical protein